MRGASVTVQSDQRQSVKGGGGALEFVRGSFSRKAMSGGAGAEGREGEGEKEKERRSRRRSRNWR